MNDEYQYFTINDYEVIVIYGSIQYKRQGRISYKENLSDGEPVFHNPGNSKVFQVTCDILIPIYEDEENSLFNEINKNVTENKSVTINSNFGKLFPSGEYYIDNGWSRKRALELIWRHFAVSKSVKSLAKNLKRLLL